MLYDHISVTIFICKKVLSLCDEIMIDLYNLHSMI